jgi:long-chain acyl-CoA synthetase
MDSPQLVHQLLEQSARQRPDHYFLIHEGVRSTYAEVDAGANRMARVLLAERLSRGDRVGILARNSRFYVEAYFGIQKAGGIAVPLNPMSGGSRLADVLQACDAGILLAGAGCEEKAVSLLARPGPLRLLALQSVPPSPETGNDARILNLVEACEAQSTVTPKLSLNENDATNIIYTSGSTGTPLGVTLSHANIVANARSIVSCLELVAQDSVLQVLPFQYVYGQSLLSTHALVGGTVVIENRFMYPEVALDTMETEACTGFSGVPSHIAILLNRSSFADRSLTDLRYVTTAGGALSPALTRRLMDALPGRKIFIMYGATEASARLSCLSPQQLPHKLGSIGKAIPGVELRILNKDGSEAADNQRGEIVARGPNIMSGYWQDPAATATVMDGNRYHTGDLAYRDEDGFLFVVGRERDIIKAGANRVSAKEIEDVIHENPQVHEVAVIAVADEILGEKICAYVVARNENELDVEHLLKTLRNTLPVYKIPSEIIILAELPKNDSGKILKQELAVLYQENNKGTEGES